MPCERRGRVAVTGVAGLRARRPIGGAAAQVRAIAGPADAGPPVTLADLDLTEAGRRELRGEGGHELVGEAVDRRVVSRARRRLARVRARVRGWARPGLRHSQTSSCAGGSSRPRRGPGSETLGQRPGSSMLRSRSANPGPAGGAGAGAATSV